MIKVLDGVHTVFDGRIIDGNLFASVEPLKHVPNFAQFCKDVVDLAEIMSDGATASYSFNRLTLLECMFGIHLLVNSDVEKAAMKSLPKDFSHLPKVDGCVRLSSGMLAKHLLQFIRTKLVQNVRHENFGFFRPHTSDRRLSSLLSPSRMANHCL